MSVIDKKAALELLIEKQFDRQHPLITGRMDTLVQNATLIKTETDKIPDIKTETDKIPATITKIDNLVDLNGILIKKEDHKCDGDGAQADDIFTFTGPILIKEYYMIIKAATDATTFTGVQFNLHDETNDVALDGDVSGSATVAGSLFGKFGNQAADLVTVKADEVRIIENASHPSPFYGIIAVPKAGDVANTVQLLFTGDSDTDIDVDIYMRYVPLTSDAGVTVTTAE